MQKLLTKICVGALLITELLPVNAQDVELKKFYVHDINSMRTYLQKIIRQTLERSETKNIPISGFVLGNRICGFYYSQYKGPFAKVYTNSSDWTSFITCSGEGGPTKLLYANYLTEHIEKEKTPPKINTPLKMMAYAKEKEGERNAELSIVPIDYIAFNDKVLLFYNYKMYKKSKDKGSELEPVERFLLVKEYDKDLNLVRKSKIKLFTEKIYSRLPVGILTMGKLVGTTTIDDIFLNRIDNNRFVVAYNVTRIVSQNDAKYNLHIRVFDKDLKQQGDEIVISLPFKLGNRTRFVFSEDGKRLYFAVPVVLLEETEVKGLIGKLLGKKEETEQGLFLFVFYVNLVDGEYDFGVVNLGNPKKKISSVVFKRVSSSGGETFLVALSWTLNSKRGADILKIQTNDENEWVLLDKITIKLPTAEGNNYKKGKEKAQEEGHSPFISDIVEMKNNYLLLTGDVYIVLYSDDDRLWFEVSISDPILIAVNKSDRSSRSFTLYSGEVLSMEAYSLPELTAYNKVYRNGMETMGFLKLSDDKALAFFMTTSTKIGSNTQSNKEGTTKRGVSQYVIVTENNGGEIEITRAKPLGPAEGNASSFGFRSVVWKDGYIYALFSIDNFVPALAKFKFSDK